MNTICFILFGVLFTGFLVLEGFGYGVGALLPFLGKTDGERQAMIKTLAPVWEGNQVWLITAGAVLFAGFPNAYATFFSGLYLALFLILTSLILRGVAFEFRDKENSRTWRRFWDWSMFAGSLIPALLWGVAIASLPQGLPIDADMQYAGGFLDLLSPYTLTGGLAFVLLFVLQGAAYLTVKLAGPLACRAKRTGLRLGKYTLAVSSLFAVLTFVYTDLMDKLPVWGLLPATVMAIFMIKHYLQDERYMGSFIFSSLAIIALTMAVFTGLFPRIMVSSLNPVWSLDIYNSASNPLTLKIMSITLALMLPAVVAYEAWKYSIFRQRISVAAIEFAAYAKLLAQMNQDLMNSIKRGYCFVDVLDKIIHAFRSEDGSIIKKLRYRHREMLFGKSRPQRGHEEITGNDAESKE
ncbi:cytochrome d ubiquinol oxidase subunit II [Methylomusa anaerophila]|uniref:cytochrome d ubiquinol oxidase subunit II n=1 Tax=Methylomusa anaerophila TaxID=1930071 RepID=UPI002F94187E